MKRFLASVVSLAIASTIVHANVIELGDSDFDQGVESHETVLVMFYAPWCGHCKRMKPDFEKASIDLLKNDPPIHLAKVDCTEAGKDTCSRFGVSGFPTLKIFKSGEVFNEYNGPREADGIVKYMKSQVGPASKEFHDGDEFKNFLENAGEVVVAGVLDNNKDLDIFLKAADKLREDVTFIHSKKAGGARKAGVHLYRPKRLQSKLEDSTVKYELEFNVENLMDWVKSTYHGLAGLRTNDNAKDFQGTVVVAYYNVDYTKNPKGTNYWRNRVMKVARSFPKFKFAVSNRNDFEHEVREFGWDHAEGDKPVVAIKSEEGKKYKMEDTFDVDALTKFVQEFENGNLEPYMKSEPIPESNDGGVKIAVAKNFHELVTNTDKDVLIEFYAPWCGHCKQLAPVYDELGTKMKDENVLIVKMDATANDVPPEFSVQGFPTIYWVKIGEDPVKYDSGRDLDAFIKYIAEHATDELNGYNRKGKPKKKIEL